MSRARGISPKRLIGIEFGAELGRKIRGHGRGHRTKSDGTIRRADNVLDGEFGSRQPTKPCGT